jgi:hypothetical protein
MSAFIHLATSWFTHRTRVLPILALLFLCSFLDRTNVGNARILGLESSLGLSDSQYTTGLAVFYATYVARYVDTVYPFSTLLPSGS